VRHLYLHVPFCARRCPYCDFSIAVRKRVPAQDYVAAVAGEVALVRAAGLAAPSESGLDTLYLGGGTPSSLPPDALATLLPVLFDAFHGTAPDDGVEVTLEANPEDATLDAARAWQAAGINRVSLGAQSFDDHVLSWMHRSHDAARIGDAVRALRTAGIADISLDLIFALPEELQRDWARDLECALALRPAHLSLYGLTVEARTPLARWISRGAASAPDDDRYAAEYLFAHERLARDGYRFYEISNAGLGGRRSRHNSAYWTERAYLGLGPAAHSFDGRTRRWNLAPWEAYRRAVGLGRLPRDAAETLTEAERELERRYLALRTDRGLPVGLCAPERLSAWVGAGWVRVAGERFVCAPEGWLRVDALVRDLTPGPDSVNC
jgi:oxygen-independent coproporphyrinogen-3 oxidase